MNNLNLNWKTKDTDNLFKAVLALRNVEECERFFRDLMTEQEIETFAARFKTALMLDQNLPYRQISKVTGMSTTTVTRINYWLERGMGGYSLAIKRLKSAAKNSHHHTRTNSLEFTS